MDVVMRAKGLLEATHRAPRMFASIREAMMCHVTAIVDVIIEGFDCQRFWERHLGTYGNTYRDISEPVNDQWARSVIDDALRIIEEKKQ